LLKKVKPVGKSKKFEMLGTSSSSSAAIEKIPDDTNRVTTLIIDLWESGSSVRCC
jgi:hypothetical protein